MLIYLIHILHLNQSKGNQLRLKLGTLSILGAFLLFPSGAKAYSLDEFYQATFITVVPNHITMQIELYPSVLIAL